MWSSGASGREPESASSSSDEAANDAVSGSDEAIDIRLRFGERPSSERSGDDGGMREDSNSIGSGKALRAAGDADGTSSSPSIGELSSMISWVDLVLTPGLMASAGVAKGVRWVEDGLGVKVEENRGVAWNWCGPLGRGIRV